MVRSATGSLGLYGAVDCAAAADAVFGPFYVAGAIGGSSTLTVLNSGLTPTTYHLDFLNNAGTVVYTAPDVTVAPLGSLRVASTDVPAGILGAEGFGSLRVTTGPGGSAHGVLAIERSGRLTFANALFHSGGAAVQGVASPPMAGNVNFLPRLHNRSTEAGGPFTTELLLATTEGFTNVVNISFYHNDGTMYAPPIVAMVPPGGARFYKAILENQPPGIPAVVIGRQGALAVQADTVAVDATGAEGAYAIAAYVSPSAGSNVIIPGVIRSGSTFSVVAAQNTTAATNSVTIDFLDLQGSVVHSQQRALAAGATFAVDVRSAGLPDSYIGAARISGSANVLAQLEIYSQVAFPPLNEVAISGAGVAAVGASVELTATAAPAGVRMPITYTWQIAELPDRSVVVAGLEDRQTVAWAEPGLKKVRVTAHNGASAVVAEHNVRVPAITVTAGSEPLTLAYESAAGSSVQFSAPADAVPAGSQLALTPLSRDQAAGLYGPPAAATLLGAPVLLEAVAGSTPLPEFIFAVPATLLMRYDDAGLTAAQKPICTSGPLGTASGSMRRQPVIPRCSTRAVPT